MWERRYKNGNKRGNTWIQYQEDYCKNEQLSDWRVGIEWTRNWSGSYLDMEQTYCSIWKSQSEELRRILLCSKWKDRCRGEPRGGSLLCPNSLRALFNRVKGQKLTHNQRIKIYQLIKVEEMPSSVVSSKYCLSISTINRIVSYFDAHPHELKYEDEEIGSKIFISKKVVEVVQEFINCQDTPIWSKDIWKYVQENLKISIAPNTMTKYLKSNMKMSFKRVSSRQIKVDFQRIRKLKMLFAVIWWQKLGEIRCIVNIDESTFSRATRNNYTWWRRGSPGITKNDVLTGSLNLISEILTTGSSYSAIVKGTTVSQTFIDYMEELIHYIETIDKIQMEDVLWILDNAPWHQSKKVLKYLDSKGVRYLFLPPYCPELAPVELFFSQLKKSISRAVKVPVKMNTKEGTNLVKHHIQMITPNRIKRLFSNFTKVLYSILEDTKIIWMNFKSN